MKSNRRQCGFLFFGRRRVCTDAEREQLAQSAAVVVHRLTTAEHQHWLVLKHLVIAVQHRLYLHNTTVNFVCQCVMCFTHQHWLVLQHLVVAVQHRLYLYNTTVNFVCQCVMLFTHQHWLILQHLVVAVQHLLLCSSLSRSTKNRSNQHK